MKIYNNKLKLVDKGILIDFIRSNDIIEADTETTGLDPHTKEILTIQFGNEKQQFCLIWDEEACKLSKNILEKSGKTFIFQNAKFDLKFLYKYNIYPPKVFDTFLAECVLTCGYGFKGKSLKAIAEKYIKVDISKDVRTDFVKKLNTRGFNVHSLVEDMEFIKYALDDVKYLTRIMNKQLIQIKRHNLQKALDLDNEFVKCLAYTEYCGFKLSRKKWTARYHDDITKQMDLLNKLDAYIIENGLNPFIEQQMDMFDSTLQCNVNWSSPKQVCEVFKAVGIDIKDDEGKESVGALIQQRNKDNELVKLFTDYQKTTKLVKSYGLDFFKFLNDKTERIHPNFTQILNTGRMSCSSPNLQQIPSNQVFRNCFVPTEGKTFVVADYTGQESIVFANKCRDRNLLNFYDNKLGDMHSYVAKLCFPADLKDLELKEIKKERPDLRQKAKGAGFAIQYGGNGYTISNNLNISRAEGDKVYENYCNAFPDMFDYFDKVSEEVIDQGYVTFNNVTNRKSFLSKYDEYLGTKNEYHKRKLEGSFTRMSYNYPVQGTSADITKIACIYLFQYIMKNNLIGKVLIVNIIHDEVVIECSEDMAQQMANVLQDCMEKSGKLFCKRIELKAEPNITKQWNH